MDTDSLLRRFDGRSRLLLKSLLLLSGSAVRRALWVFHRQRRSEPDLFLHTCLDTLCQDEPRLEGDTLKLTLKPLVCLFPVVFKRNLLSFLHLAHTEVPRPALTRLLDCLSQDASEDYWMQALLRQLRQDLRQKDPINNPLFTPQCRERLGELCEILRTDDGARAEERVSWFSGFVSDPPQNSVEPLAVLDPSENGAELLSVEVQRKRKSENADVDVDGEGAGSQSKRRRMDWGNEEGLSSKDEDLELGDAHLHGDTENVSKADTVDPQQLSPVGSAGTLPEHIKASISQIKELLETEVSWERGSSSVLQVLNDCDPHQVELFCSILHLSELPEQILPQFCTSLLEVSPDLSYSTAANIIGTLFLKKILSLSEPASRCLVTATTSLCSRYPRATCSSLIGPVLEARHIDNVRAELLCKLIEACLEPHHQILVFGQVLAVPWSEDMLSVIHTLLESKLELSEETFSLFITQLSQQAPHFSSSMRFSKMMLTVLTKYQSHVNAAHTHALSSCLAQNHTFLKKSLQAALKRISAS
ncbi:Fanconi anemia group E protein [Megalops cyprinoides]|uniref:Fanconi anemia group E protein n=1 Tax=Megalops cyprinoides TaxID=118141 RepID=UPI001865309A|nr:Fanconi anemia group E protein [Megalops cyprinoides]